MASPSGLRAELETRNDQQDLIESLEVRQFYANRLEAHFRAHQGRWVELLDLMVIGGPSWRSRISNDLRKKRKMRVVWNRSNRRSAYMFTEHVPLGRDASVPDLKAWHVAGAPLATSETWRLT